MLVKPYDIVLMGYTLKLRSMSRREMLRCPRTWLVLNCLCQCLIWICLHYIHWFEAAEFFSFFNSHFYTFLNTSSILHSVIIEWTKTAVTDNWIEKSENHFEQFCRYFQFCGCLFWRNWNIGPEKILIIWSNRLLSNYSYNVFAVRQL